MPTSQSPVHVIHVHPTAKVDVLNTAHSIQEGNPILAQLALQLGQTLGKEEGALPGSSFGSSIGTPKGHPTLKPGTMPGAASH